MIVLKEINLYEGILKSRELDSNEKLVLCTIATYEGKYLSNKFIGSLISLTPNCISKIITKLKKGGYVTTSYEEYQYTKKRMIHLTKKTVEMVNEGGKLNA